MSAERYFTREELIRSRIAQEKGIDNTPPQALDHSIRLTMAGLERVRAFLGHPVTVTSGFRCFALNSLPEIGGSNDSQHMRGEAADIKCPGFGSPQKVAQALVPMRYILGIDQIILEPTWVHVSFTTEPRYEVLTRVGDRYRVGLVLNSIG